MAHKFDPAHMERLLDPGRKSTNDPEYVLDQLGLAPGEVLLDFGSGPGWFALPAAKRVGEGGKVYALDVEPAMLEALMERARAAGITNVEPVLVQEGVPWPLPGGRCDAALLANVLHEVEDVGHLMAELRRVLRPGGRGFVLDWSPQAPAGVGPPPAHRLPRERAEEIVRGGGFTVSGAAAVGPYHYGFRFTPGLRP